MNACLAADCRQRAAAASLNGLVPRTIIISAICIRVNGSEGKSVTIMCEQPTAPSRCITQQQNRVGLECG